MNRIAARQAYDFVAKTATHPLADRRRELATYVQRTKDEHKVRGSTQSVAERMEEQFPLAQAFCKLHNSQAYAVFALLRIAERFAARGIGAAGSGSTFT